MCEQLGEQGPAPKAPEDDRRTREAEIDVLVGLESALDRAFGLLDGRRAAPRSACRRSEPEAL